jgi:hypothetical protein
MTINFEGLLAQPSLPEKSSHQNADVNRNRWLSELDQALFSEDGKEPMPDAAPYSATQGRAATSAGIGNAAALPGFGEAKAGTPVRVDVRQALPNGAAGSGRAGAARLSGRGEEAVQDSAKAMANGPARPVAPRLPVDSSPAPRLSGDAATSFFSRGMAGSGNAGRAVGVGTSSSASQSGSASAVSVQASIQPARSGVAPVQNNNSPAWNPAWQTAPTVPAAAVNSAYGGFTAASHESSQSSVVANTSIPAVAAASFATLTATATPAHAETPAEPFATGKDLVEGDDVDQSEDTRGAQSSQALDEYDQRLMHVSQDDAGVHAWIRDAAIGTAQLPALTLAMASELGAAGVPLAELTVNGRRIDLPRGSRPMSNNAEDDEFVTESTTGFPISSTDIQGAL